MRQVVVADTGVSVRQVPAPRPGPGEVLVRSVVAGVCGSDVHAARGRHPFVPLPYVPGHEVVGVVVQVGAGVRVGAGGAGGAGSKGGAGDEGDEVVGSHGGIRPGQRVTVEPDLPCWSCKPCRTGRQNLCENLRFFGCGYAQGGLADYFALPADRLHLVPDDLDYRSAALIEPLSTPVHAARLAGDLTGAAVAILGAGTIGLLMLAVVRASGARRVVCTDMLAAKRKHALALGAHAAVDPTAPDAVRRIRDELGESADVVFDCVAAPPTVEQAIRLADKGGTVVVVGVPAREVTVPLPLIQDHQIRIQGSATYLPADYAESIALLRSGAVRADDIVSSVRPLARVAEAFALAQAGAVTKVLVVVDPDAFAQPAPG